MQQVRVKQDNYHVQFIINNAKLFKLYWADADYFADNLRHIFNGTTTAEVVDKYVVLQLSSSGIHLFYKGNLALEIPRNIIKELFRAVKGVAREAESLMDVHKTIYDQAILLKGGATFGLLNDPKAIDESIKTALWDTQIRRYFNTPGIPSKATFGVPSVIGGEIDKWFIRI